MDLVTQQSKGETVATSEERIEALEAKVDRLELFVAILAAAVDPETKDDEKDMAWASLQQLGGFGDD